MRNARGEEASTARVERTNNNVAPRLSAGFLNGFVDVSSKIVIAPSDV